MSMHYHHILDNLAIFIPFNSFFRCWKHWIRFLCLFEEASFTATFTFHHQIMFGLMYSWLINILFSITLITGINICPEMTFKKTLALSFFPSGLILQEHTEWKITGDIITKDKGCYVLEKELTSQTADETGL